MKEVATSPETDSVVALPNIESIIRGLLYVYIFSLPFKNLLFIERNGFVILVVLLALWFVVNRRHFFVRTPIDLPLLAFVAWVGITVPFATYPDYSFKEFAKLLQQGMLFYVVVYFFKGTPKQMRLMQVLIGASLVVSGYGIVEFMGMAGILSASNSPTVLESVTPGEVWLSTYLVMVIPICLAFSILDERQLERTVYLGATGLAIVCLMLTFSRAGLFALFCELGCMVWLIRRKTLIIVTLLSCLLIGSVAAFMVHYGFSTVPGTSISIRGTSPNSLVHRLDIWKYTLARITEHPFVGIGYGKDNFKLVFGQSEEKIRAPEELARGHIPVHKAGTHNTLLDLALGTGIPGLAFFTWLVYRIVATSFRGFRQIEDPAFKAILLGTGVSVIGMCVRLFFDHMLIGTLAILFWILVAMAMLAHSTADQTQAQSV